MISTKEIFLALSDMIHAVLPDIYVTADSVQKSDTDYIWIQFNPQRKDEGYGMTRREIRVSMSVVPAPDEYTETYDSRLLEIADALDEATCGYIKILDRYITIYDSDYHIFDNILHYSFILDFADYIDKDLDALNQGASYEKMENLKMTERKK